MTRMLQRMDVLAKVEGLGCTQGRGPSYLSPDRPSLPPLLPAESQRGGRAADGGC